MEDKVMCKIEHHAVLFALLSKQAITLAGEVAVQNGIAEFIAKFGQEYFDVLGEIDHAEF